MYTNIQNIKSWVWVGDRAVYAVSSRDSALQKNITVRNDKQ
jgi:hypothetical protein